MKEFVKQVGLK